ncbi:hypothetical protein ACFW2Y_11030 [Streptomyces sp. NPDC058877]|uniref:hypothetical protein n=1 Tax=Streptomyces sp. NPDC058877 TaxID=3346665 RepID=UPI0036BEFCDB
MQDNLHALGFRWLTLPLHLRAALRHYHLWEGRALAQRFALAALAYGLAMMITAKYVDGRPLAPVAGVLFFWLPLYSLIPLIGARRQVRHFQLVAACAGAIAACASVAAAAGGSNRPQALRAASVSIRSVERAVFRARRTQRTVAFGRRSRKAALRRHAGQVAAELRAAEARIDCAHQAAALEDLAGLLVRIAASGATCRIGALLPESITEQHKPVRDFELVRLAAATLMVLGAAVAVALWEVPDAAAWAVIAGVGLLSAIVAFGANWRRFVSVIEIFRP